MKVFLRAVDVGRRLDGRRECAHVCVSVVVRGLAYRTRDSYVDAVVKLAKFYGRGPDQITQEQVQAYLLRLLQERKLAHSTCNIVCSALQFFYRVDPQAPRSGVLSAAA